MPGAEAGRHEGDERGQAWLPLRGVMVWAREISGYMACSVVSAAAEGLTWP